jgi:uncharacterized protein YpiB (UPF0302 family)
MIEALIAALDPNDPLHAEVRKGLERRRKLIERRDVLLQKQKEALDAADAAAAEFDKLTEELRALELRHEHVLASLRPSTERMQ